MDLIDHRFKYRALYEEAIRAAHREGTPVEVGGAKLPVVPLHYLVAMKLIAGRPQDEADLDLLLKRADLDYTKSRGVVEAHAGEYAARALDRFARNAGRADAPRDYADEYGGS
ncbi:MAG: hypothetical protein IT384_20260 [Deltaproteobacteria bacterium]|nr:hypothetical protein [Deltaproteobacteria bacterium]